MRLDSNHAYLRWLKRRTTRAFIKRRRRAAQHILANGRSPDYKVLRNRSHPDTGFYSDCYLDSLPLAVPRSGDFQSGRAESLQEES